MTKDYYAILGVPRAANGATIHSAFRERARQYHPDAGAGSSAPKFSEALEAYHTLSDPQLRRQHDIDLGTPTRQSNIIPEPLFAPERSWPDYRHSGAYQFDIVRELFELIESDLDFSIRVSCSFNGICRKVGSRNSGIAKRKRSWSGHT